MTGPNRVAVPKNINLSSIIYAAMDNFDHEESTPSGTEGSHDTILVLIQKSDMVEIQEVWRYQQVVGKQKESKLHS